MPRNAEDIDNQLHVPLNRPNEDDDIEADDIDVNGIVDPLSSRSVSQEFNSIPSGDTTWHALVARFARVWRRIPSSWSVERDPVRAFRDTLTLSGFLILCIFIFSIPSILHVVSPRAPAPPGTSPGLDEAASTISGKYGAVAADHAVCSELGVKVLRDMKGNAVDAMVATVLCQGILSPFASGIGGGAFILIHEERTGISRFYDARETAPMAAKMSQFRRNSTAAKFGGLSVAVPGELRGLHMAHSHAGKLNWSEVVKPAIEVAENAKVGKFLAIKLQQMNETIFSSPSLQRIFTKRVRTKRAESEQAAQASVELPGMRRSVDWTGEEEVANKSRGVVESLQDESVVMDANDKDEHGVKTKPEKGADGNETFTMGLVEEGDKLVNEALVQTLKDVAEKGPSAFYMDRAEKLAAEIQEAGGMMTKNDIEMYKPIMREALRSSYQGFSIIGAPPPSAGGAMIALALNMITELDFGRRGRNQVTYQMLTETLKWIFGARMVLADPEFVASTYWQTRRMMSRREAMRRVYRIEQDRTHRPEFYSRKISTSKLEDGTCHVSIVDKDGMGVSVTSTINLAFGAGLVSNSSGAILNDEMDAFTTSMTRSNAFGMYPTAENRVAGGKRAVSSMCPTIVLWKGKVFAALGGSGGPKAVSGVLQTLVNMIAFGDRLSDAISAPRVHHQLVPNVVSMEGANGDTCEAAHGLRPADGAAVAPGQDAWPYWPSVCKALEHAGHRVQGPAVHGAVQAVVRSYALQPSLPSDQPTVFAASDPRRIGKAAAY